MLGHLKNISFISLALWLLRAVMIVLILWGIITTMLNNPYNHHQWIDMLVFGIMQGSLYALIAVGFTLVYRMVQLINFAHGEFFMSGVMMATIFVAVPMNKTGFFAQQPYLALLIITIIAVTVSVLFAWLTERVVYRPLRNGPHLLSSIAALGASLFWRGVFMGVFGAQVIIFPQIPAWSGTITFFGTALMKSQIIAIFISGLTFIGLVLLIKRTKIGKTIRAVAENKGIAILVGINIDRTVTITFGVGAAMAGIAGVLYAIVYGKAYYYMGFFPGIKAFTAALLGGIGSIPGAILGGLFLGIFESVGPGLFLEGLGIPSSHQLRDVIAFAVLIFILIFRPQRLMRQ
jgi:branched-chain amino acid transport system permease protein